MRYFYGGILFICASISGYYATRIFVDKNYRKISKRLSAALSFASCLWSFSYGIMQVVDNIDAFYVFRGLGILGIVLCIVIGQVGIGVFTDTLQKIRWWIWAEVIIGLPVLYMVISPSSITYEQTPLGIITTFISAGISIAYTLYFVLIAIVYVVLSFDMTSKKYLKRVRAVGRSLLVLMLMLLLGMIVDTVLPAVGINFNIPASSMLQFVGLDILYHALEKLDKNVLNKENIAGYVYQELKLPVIIFDAEHVLRIANDAARTFFGVEGENDSEIAIEDFWVDNFGIDVADEMYGIKEHTNIEAVYAKNGTAYELAVHPICNSYDDYIGYMVLVSDLTKHISQIESIEAEKSVAEKENIAKSLLIANLSHELKTPMNAILGFSELAMNENIDRNPEKVREYVSNINDATLKLASTVDSIINVSDLESGQMKIEYKEYDTAQLFKTLSTMASMKTSKKGLTFKLEVADNFPKILIGDRTKVREIVANVVNNAIKFTNKGEVKVKAEVLNVRKDGAKICVEVSDTGIGMTKEEISGVFGAFNRSETMANRMTEGMGLGLSVAKGLVSLLDGDITATSTKGEGSVFRIVFVQKLTDEEKLDYDIVEYEADNEDDAVEESYLEPKFGHANILSVDDSESWQKSTSSLFEKYGYAIDLAMNGYEAIEKCKKERYDIIFMDQMMPEMDGIVAMNRIRELRNGYEKGGRCKIVAFTSNHSYGIRDEFMKAGFDDYMTKPINRLHLETVLKIFIQK